MKHSIKSKQPIDSHNTIVEVQLFPDHSGENTAIKNMASLTASQNEKELIENYLNFSLEELGEYSVVELLSHKDTSFVLKIFV